MKNRIKFNQLSGERGIFELIQESHAVVTGQIEEGDSNASMSENLSALCFANDNWERQGVETEAYDNAVHELVKATIVEIKDWESK